VNILLFGKSCNRPHDEPIADIQLSLFPVPLIPSIQRVPTVIQFYPVPNDPDVFRAHPLTNQVLSYGF
jgi:hypothetical protein